MTRYDPASAYRKTKPVTEDPLEILRTPRLILTRLQSAHVPALAALWTDPEVTRRMGGPREIGVLTADLEKTARDPYAEKYDLWTLVERESGIVIGHCGLIDKEVAGITEIELVYVLAASAWGKGYGVEIAAALKASAFTEFGLTRLISLIDPENRASERVAQKIGMRLEREVIRPGGAVRRLYAIHA